MFNTLWVDTAGRCTLQNRLYGRKLTYILCEARENQAKGKTLSAELFGLKLLAELK